MAIELASDNSPTTVSLETFVATYHPRVLNVIHAMTLRVNARTHLDRNMVCTPAAPSSFVVAVHSLDICRTLPLALDGLKIEELDALNTDLLTLEAHLNLQPI